MGLVLVCLDLLLPRASAVHSIPCQAKDSSSKISEKVQPQKSLAYFLSARCPVRCAARLNYSQRLMLGKLIS